VVASGIEAIGRLGLEGVMTTRVARIFSSFLVLLLALAGPALAAEGGRTIVTSDNSDYFGFDLRAEQNFSLDQCKTTCLADSSCRAFTYNTKAKWCFLKSDYNLLKPFSGAVAGKVVNISGEPDIGAPAELGSPTRSRSRRTTARCGYRWRARRWRSRPPPATRRR
jgi:hypothetical protein